LSTRGLYGFRVGGVDKLAFNQCDSYPEGLGLGVKEFLDAIAMDDDGISAIAKGIVLVHEEARPTPAQVGGLRSLGIKVPEPEPEGELDWYHALRSVQGDLIACGCGLRYMTDGRDFLTSIYCEWVYVLDTDTHMLEVHRGGNGNPKAAGRYASRLGDVICGEQTYGPSLIAAVTFEGVRRLSSRSFLEMLACEENCSWIEA